MKTRTLALALVLTSAVSAPAAASPSAKLTYVRGPGAETCPDESELRRAVATRLGYDPFFPSASKTVVAEIRARARAGYRGVVQIIDEHGIVRGERALETQSSDCTEMVRVLALGISIAIDDLDELPGPPPPEPPVSATPTLEAPSPPPQKDEPALPAEHAEPARPASLQLETLVGVHGSLGLAPALSGGVTVGLGIASRSASLRLEGTAELPSSERIDTGGTVSTSFLVASVVPCVRRGIPFACATASLGSFHGGAEGIAAPRAQSVFFAMLGARAGALVPLYAMLSLAPHADVAVPLLRHSVAVGGRTVFTAPALGGALGFDLQALFP